MGAPPPAPDLLYHALGGGHGHALRALAVVGRLRRGAVVIPARLRPWAEALRVPALCPPEALDAEGVRRWVRRLPPPRLLVADVFPRGVVGELAPWLGRVPAWLVTRRVQPARYLSPAARQAIEEGFERVVWTEEPPAELGRLPVPVERLGPVLLQAPSLGRAEARASLGLPAAGPVVLGLGSGPEHRQERMARLLEKAAFRLGAQAVFLSRELPEGRVVRAAFPAARWFGAADVVVAAGGYHAYHETRAAGVRAVFVPQARSWDDQEWRVRDCSVARSPQDLERLLGLALASPPPVPVPADGALALAARLRERLQRD